LKSAKINIRGPVYRYNTETCRYERARHGLADAFFYTTALVLTAVLMLAGLLILHDLVIDSEKEKLFRKENFALQKSHSLISKQLDELDVTLASLQAKDRELHVKFFSSGPETESAQTPRSTKRDMLLSDAPTLHTFLSDVEEQSDRLLNKASASTDHYSQHMNIGFYTDMIPSLPLAQPIAGLAPQNIISGYGMRINPFHKGMYNHPGVDIAVARGTQVFATAAGKVITVKYSTLQAGYGNYVEVDHGNGFLTRYAHLEEIHVRKGETVNKASLVGTTGISGGSAAPHLHYEIVRGGKNVDPILYMIEGITSEKHEQFRAAAEKVNQSLD
jgi:murein DD-endopeptidase MepM/ murein hydrolase activator NlpD